MSRRSSSAGPAGGLFSMPGGPGLLLLLSSVLFCGPLRSGTGPSGDRGYFTPLLVGGPAGVEVVWVRKALKEVPAFLQVRWAGGVLPPKPAGKGAVLRVPLPALEGKGPFAYRFTWKGGATPWYSFRPLPGKGAAGVRLAAYGDSRSNPKVHRALAELMKARKPDLVLNTGDLVGSGPLWSQWERSYLKPLAVLGSHVPIFTVIGNHEREARAYYELCSRSGPEKAWWSADVGPLHLVGLDSNVPLEPGSPQRKWLEDDLRRAAGTASWKILLLHHPFFTSAPGRRPSARVRSLLPLLLERGVSLVFEGHDHHYMRTFPVVMALEERTAPGLVCVTTGGGGAHLYPQKRMPFAAKEVMAWHYVLLDADPESLSGKVYDWEGKLLDRWKITRKSGMEGPRYWVGGEALAEAVRAGLDRLGPLLLSSPFPGKILLPVVLPGSPPPPAGMTLFLEGRPTQWRFSTAASPRAGKAWNWTLAFLGGGLPRAFPWPRVVLDLGVPGLAGRIQPMGWIPLWKPRGPWGVAQGRTGKALPVSLLDQAGRPAARGFLSVALKGSHLDVRFFSPLGKTKTSKARPASLAQWASGTRAECLALHLCGPGGKALQSFQVTRSYRSFLLGGPSGIAPGKAWSVKVLPGRDGKGWGASWEIDLPGRGLPLPAGGLRFQVSHFLTVFGIRVSSGPLKSDREPWPAAMRPLSSAGAR